MRLDIAKVTGGIRGWNAYKMGQAGQVAGRLPLSSSVSRSGRYRFVIVSAFRGRPVSVPLSMRPIRGLAVTAPLWPGRLVWHRAPYASLRDAIRLPYVGHRERDVRPAAFTTAAATIGRLVTWHRGAAPFP